MGGIFSAPSPPAQAATPAPAPVEDPEVAARAARLEALERRRRGLAGTVNTSYRGVLAPSTLAQGLPATDRKSLLGE
ncbi:hypothetical protein [Elioraea sp.]|uniref:hypothetical protein n=1 Tax=Elioraea sp. TaxID=2185103 RepID=UPI0025BA1E47|nr:hypothetical protein [Elioraea sp.]